MIQQPEIWLKRRLKILNDMLSINNCSLGLRSVRIGNSKVFITIEDMEKVLELLKQRAPLVIEEKNGS